MAKKKRRVFSGIGGQAVLEGIMMKNKDKYAVAVRKPDGDINVEVFEDKSIANNKTIKKIPFVRGVFNFIDSMVTGMKIITYSASFYEDEEPADKKEGLFEKVFKDKAEDVATGITVFISILLAVGLFMVLPYAISELCGKFVLNDSLIAIIEGVVRLVIFLIYIVAITAMKDIRRLYQYHGAEHKCINCVETGRPLTVRNVMRCSRLHKRCGTSFLLIVMIITIICFFFIRVDQVWLRVVLRLALIPVIAGVSYEILKFSGRHDNVFVNILSAPGRWLQLLTTKEPDEEMVEVAIASVEAVFDWEKFEKKNFKQKMVKRKKKLDDGSMVETDEMTMQIDVIELEERLADLARDGEESTDSNRES